MLFFAAAPRAEMPSPERVTARIMVRGMAALQCVVSDDLPSQGDEMKPCHAAALAIVGWYLMGGFIQAKTNIKLMALQYPEEVDLQLT